MNGTIQSTIIGTICADPEPRFSPADPSKLICAVIRVAINRSVKDGDKWKTQTQFIDITAYSFQAQLLTSPECRWCRKGYHAWFNCEQSEEVWTGRDGKEHRKPAFKLLAAKPILVKSDEDTYHKKQEKLKFQQETSPATAGTQNKPSTPAPQDDEDIPF